MPQSPGFLKQVWHKFKALRLPWRRHYLIGADLVGNTFWEFKDALHANRWRRIVKYPRSTHYADIKISRAPPLPETPWSCTALRGTAPSLTTGQRNGTSGFDTRARKPPACTSSSWTWIGRRR